MLEFAGTASPRPDPVGQARVEAFIVEQYNAGRSLRELAELTDRSFSAVRNILAPRAADSDLMATMDKLFGPDAGPLVHGPLMIGDE